MWGLKGRHGREEVRAVEGGERVVGSRSTVLSEQFALIGTGDVECLAQELAVFTPRE